MKSEICRFLCNQSCFGSSKKVKFTLWAIAHHARLTSVCWPRHTRISSSWCGRSFSEKISITGLRRSPLKCHLSGRVLTISPLLSHTSLLITPEETTVRSRVLPGKRFGFWKNTHGQETFANLEGR